jgi:hypothetical protein
MEGNVIVILKHHKGLCKSSSSEVPLLNPWLIPLQILDPKPTVLSSTKVSELQTDIVFFISAPTSSGI